MFFSFLLLFFFIFPHHIISCLPFSITLYINETFFLFFFSLPLGSSLQSCRKWLCDFLWSAGMAGVLSWCLCTLFVRRELDVGGRREGKRRRIDVLISSVYISQGSGVSNEWMIKVPFYPTFHLYAQIPSISANTPAKECSLDVFFFKKKRSFYV